MPPPATRSGGSCCASDLIAPRPHLSLAGDLDALTPRAGLEKIDRELQRVYAAAGHPERWKLLRFRSDRATAPPVVGGRSRRADPAGGPREDRPRTAARLCRRRPPGAVEAAALPI